MKKLMIYTMTALFATIAVSIAAPDKDAMMAKEKAAWQAFKDKNAADFKKVVDTAMVGIYKSGEINPIYEKWFLRPIPPKGINLNVPMGPAFKKVVASPTDSGDPAVY